MSEVKPSAEQIASIRYLRGRLDNSADPHGVRVSKGDLRDALDLMDALTNPQPDLPTEPGTAWHDKDGGVWLVTEAGLLWDGHDPDLKAADFAPFTRLVPERPPVTREAIRTALGGLGLPAYSREEATRRIVALIGTSPA